jgi:hypothetical protein
MVNISVLYLGPSFEPKISEFHAFLPFLQEIIATVQTCLTRSSRAEMKKRCLTLSLAKPRQNAQNNYETLSAIYVCTHITSHCYFERKNVVKLAAISSVVN